MKYALFQGIDPYEGYSVLKYLIKLYTKNVQNFRQLSKVACVNLTKAGVIKSASHLMHDLWPNWVEKSNKVGIRPQLFNTREVKLEMDFIIKHGEQSVHVLNSISPAFTSSFAVAEHVVNEIHAAGISVA